MATFEITLVLLLVVALVDVLARFVAVPVTLLLVAAGERAEFLDMRNTGAINDETTLAIAAQIDDAEASLGPALTRAGA